MNIYKNQVGLIGTHKDGEALLRNLTRNCFSVSIFDYDKSKYKGFLHEGFRCFETISEMLDNLCGLKVVFITSIIETKIQSTIDELISLLPEGSIIIDASNSSYKSNVLNYKNCRLKKINYVGCSFNCDYNALMNKANIIISGDEAPIEIVTNILKDCCIEGGLFYSGKIGSSSFIKMVQDSIELGMVKSLVEGMNILNESNYEFDIEKVLDNFSKNSEISGNIVNKMKDIFYIKNNNVKQESINALHRTNQTLKTALELDCEIPTISSAYYSIEHDIDLLDDISYNDKNVNDYYSIKNKLDPPEYLDFTNKNK